MESKGPSEAVADILIIFCLEIGSVGMTERLLDQGKSRLTQALAHKGIYILGMIQSRSDYLVHVVTIREHPLFAGEPTVR